MKYRSYISKPALLAGLLMALAACQSSGPTAVQRGSLGEELSSLCFNDQLNGWQPLDRSAIILEKGINHYYRIGLTGICDPERAGPNIVTRSRGGICLKTGDEIDFPGDFAPSCTVNQINAWVPAAE